MRGSADLADGCLIPPGMTKKTCHAPQRCRPPCSSGQSSAVSTAREHRTIHNSLMDRSCTCYGCVMDCYGLLWTLIESTERSINASWTGLVRVMDVLWMCYGLLWNVMDCHREHRAIHNSPMDRYCLSWFVPLRSVMMCHQAYRTEQLQLHAACCR